MTTVSPPARADAQRNRQALLDAAHAVFAESGLEASLDEIAQRAGVGNATLYRHFGSRCGLVVATLVAEMTRYAEAAETAAQADDPWCGLAEYITTITAMQARNRGLADLVTTESVQSPEVDELRSRARRATIRTIRRAQRAGVLRSDFTPQDVLLILMANAGVVARTGPQAEATSPRVVGLLLDGLRADAATSTAPPPPSERALIDVMRGC